MRVRPAERDVGRLGVGVPAAAGFEQSLATSSAGMQTEVDNTRRLLEKVSLVAICCRKSLRIWFVFLCFREEE